MGIPRLFPTPPLMIDRRRFWHGDPGYFKEVIRQHGPVVTAVCRAFGESEDDTMDLVQQVWIRAYLKRGQFRGDGPLGAWLCRIARHLCTDVHRARQLQAGKARNFFVEGGIDEVHPPPDRPDEEMERRENEQQLWVMLDALPDKEREAIVLKILEERSPEEVAEQMNIAKASVRSNISRGLARMRGIIKGGNE